MTNSPIPGDVVARLRRVIARAEDNAGTLPAKDAVKLRPYDWHAVTDQGRQAADLIEALQFDVGKYKSRLETVFAEKEALQRELAEARAEIYVPGEFCCPKCSFFLSQFSLRASDGAIGERDEPGEKCPNDGSPLWRVTWKQRAGEHYDRAVEEMNRATAAESQASSARRLALEGAAKAAYSTPDYIHIEKDGSWSPGSPYDRGRFDAQAAILALIDPPAAIRDIKGET